ncbi:MAG: hypothetical protein KGL01_04180, partial [Betaproteobacteria bacterium]|nr:hypothetical protein [Betaproteobacteria bacterium]
KPSRITKHVIYCFADSTLKGKNIMLAILNTQRMSLTNVLLSGLAATIVVTITMLMSGTNIVQALGDMLLGMDASVTARYLAGGVVHLAIGLTYGVFFALFFAPVSEWNKVTKGVIFGFFITVMALVFLPLAASMMSSKSATQIPNSRPATATNPCTPGMPKTVNPCNPSTPKVANPCKTGNPCAPRMGNPCNPKIGNPCNPGNPCASKSTNPCAPEMKNPCAAGNPCNPRGGSGGNSYGGLISLINHIILGLVLAFTVRLRKDESDKVA